jgi:hypothetical protein
MRRSLAARAWEKRRKVTLKTTQTRTQNTAVITQQAEIW